MGGGDVQQDLDALRHDERHVLLVVLVVLALLLPPLLRHLVTDLLFLKHDSRILRQSSNPVCGYSMMEQVRLCAVWPTENQATVARLDSVLFPQLYCCC